VLLIAAPKNVWITGASTGIGRELALLYAGRGCNVAISARSADKLNALAGQHKLLSVFAVDVTDQAAVARTYDAITAQLGAIDLAILNAGSWDQMVARDFDARRVADSMAVNYTGMANALEPLIRGMVARRSGHLALVASVAGYRGLPKAAAYAPTKAALISLAEVLRLELAADNIAVSVINPGFVATPMTSVNTFPMPFILTAEDAARRIVAGLDNQKFEIAFPWQLVAILKLLRIMPGPLYYRIARRIVTPR
jgi:short-subunit dehydrogenase